MKMEEKQQELYVHLFFRLCISFISFSFSSTESSHANKATPPRGRQIASCLKKSELRIGESSAFFTYVKSTLPRSSAQGIIHDLENTKLYSSTQDKLDKRVSQVANDTQDFERAEVRETGGRPRTSDPLRPDNARAFSTGSSIYIEVQENETLADNLPTSRRIMELPQLRNSRMETYSQVHIDPRSDSQPDVLISHSNTISMEKSLTPPVPKEFPQLNNSRTETNSHWQTSYPYFHPGLMNQVMMPQYPHFPQYSPHVPNMPSFPYYPMGLCLQPGQIPLPQHQWPSFGTDVKLSKVDRREAALMKFRQKRKERCFDKKIRYVNRKRLAEKRPRVRGQFVRKMNGIDVDLNGTPGSVDLDEDEDEEDEDENAGVDFSPEDDA